jgi:hypothetical protein
MFRESVAVLIVSASVAAVSGQGKPPASVAGDLDGTWKLNRELSQFPREVGFGMDVTGAGRPAAADAGLADTTSQSGNVGLAVNRPASREEAENSRQLVGEVRTPPLRLTIVRSGNAIVITDERGRARTYHPDGREAFTPLDAAPVATVARWEGGRLIVRYKVEPGREVRYTVSRRTNPMQLVVQAELLERGGRDVVVRIYEPASADEPLPEPAAAPPVKQAPPVIPLPSQRPGAAPPAPAQQPGAPDAVRQTVPAVPTSAPPANLDQSPGAELKGLSALGIVVEDLGAEATSCGLKKEVLEAAAAKSLSAGGLKVLRTDEDSYLYLRVVTAFSTTGTCFSRYDAIVYSYTAATMSYGTRPALVQVSLLSRGGMSASGVKGHGEAVTRALTQYVDQFAAQIQDANK